MDSELFSFQWEAQKNKEMTDEPASEIIVEEIVEEIEPVVQAESLVEPEPIVEPEPVVESEPVVEAETIIIEEIVEPTPEEIQAAKMAEIERLKGKYAKKGSAKKRGKKPKK